MKKLKSEVVLSLADGYGSGHHVLVDLDINHDYYAVENCPIKRKIADHNSCGMIRPVHDIYEVEVCKLEELSSKNNANYSHGPGIH